MRQVIIRQRAKRDLQEIWYYSAAQWGVAQADSYVSMIQKAIERMVVDGARAARCDTLYPDLRRARAGSHILFFLVDAENIDVVRILHQQMDFEAHLDMSEDGHSDRLN